MRFFGGTFLLPVTHFFIYQEWNVWLDRLYKYSFKPSDEIAIITIDDATLNTLQKRNQTSNDNLKMLTISKAVYIDLIERLQSVWVKGIAFDIVFQNSDIEEEKFAKLMQESGNIVIATTLEKDYGYIESNRLEWTQCSDCYSGIPRSVYKDVIWWHVNVESILDRRLISIDISKAPYSKLKPENEQFIDTLPLALYKATWGDTKWLFPWMWEKKLVLQPFFWWDSRGNPPRPYKTYSLSEVLSLPPILKSLKGKYIFIGESGTLIHDSFISPVTRRLMDGVESHAHFLDGILQKRFLESWSIDSISFFVWIIVFMFFMISVYLLSPKFVSIFTAIILTVWMIWISRFLFENYDIVIDIGLVLLAGSIFSFPITYIYRFFIIEREKRMLTSAFSHYVDSRVVEKISLSGRPINLGGESRRLSILFSDIAGFTTLSEKLTPEKLFSLMSLYLSRMTEILTGNGGTLDKYIGDAVMGFYGAPLEDTNHAIHACETALKMRAALPDFNREIQMQALDPIDFRVGIATGDVLVGNIGSNDRFNYTVLGDTVNLASRLEWASKEYGTHILVPEGTYQDAKDQFLFRKLDKIAVKGKNEGIFIYELIAKKSDQKWNVPNQDLYEKYEQGLEQYFAWNYLEAGKIFESQSEKDPPSAVLAKRCLDILEGRVVIENGIYRMENK
jgi:class 3 adenylate cyclase